MPNINSRENQMNIKKKIDALLPEIISIRQDLHAHPELSEQESRTAVVVSQYLTALDIPHQTGVAGHGVVGLIQGKGEKTVAIRADMDALPIAEAGDAPYKSQNSGVMHACGHDIHTAVLLGAAKILKDMQEQLEGSVKLIFQPAEETVGGALPMIQAGCLENPKVDAIISLHVEPDIPVNGVEFRRGSMNAASNEFTVTVNGVSSHGAHPNGGIDAILAASHIVVALQSIVSRNVDPADPAVVTVGQFHSGVAKNVMAGQAVFKGIVRTLSPKTRAFAVQRVEDIAKSTALAYGASAQVDFLESYPALINDDWVEDILEKTAAALLPADHIFFRPQSSMGAEDFAYFCNEIPGAYFNIGTLPSSESPIIPLHSEFYCPSEDCIPTGILMEVAGALALLSELNKRDIE